MDFTALQHLHVTAAALSLLLFVVRAPRGLRDPADRGGAVLRITPHIVDTLLLVSALALLWQLGKAAFAGWIAAKIAGLIAYVVLGTIALHRGRTLQIRVIAFIAALVVFGYIVSVAITKSPLGFLS